MRAIALQTLVLGNTISVSSENTNSFHGVLRSLFLLFVPVFFYISGAETIVGDSFLKYALEASKQMLAPLAVSVLVLLWPISYFNQVTTNNPLVQLGKMLAEFPQQSNWLWGLAALYIVTLVTYPLMVYAKRRKEKIEHDKDDKKLIGGQAIAMLVMLAVFKPMMDQTSWKFFANAVIIQFGAFLLYFQVL